ncbi:hypothetical protein FRC18_000318 [Serendipita sp. 400]|nr:hypothetical protein FRC18_000318 [Serendipita sp. 400]
MARTNRKRKLPITAPLGANYAKQGSSVPSLLPTSASSKVTKGIIRRFHSLQKEKSKLLRGAKVTNSNPSRLNSNAKTDASTYDGVGPNYNSSLKRIDDELANLGGLERYQAMSAIGQSSFKGGGAERVLIPWLKEMKETTLGDEYRAKRQRKSGRTMPEDPSPQKQAKKMRLLDVGALKHDNYMRASSMIEATAMDLHSRHPSIIERDFLTISPGLSNDELGRQPWDVISLSLVLNFVPDPKERGRMLRLAHELLDTNGFLFVVLPLPCVLNSRYLTHSHWISLLECVGFVSVKERWKPGGKVGYWLFQKRGKNDDCRDNYAISEYICGNGPALTSEGFTKKSEMNPGAIRNNFCILL